MSLTDHTQGSQSVVVNLLASLFMLLFAALILYFAWRGPDPNSVFKAFRSAAVLYPMAVVGTLATLGMAALGLRKSWLLWRQPR